MSNGCSVPPWIRYVIGCETDDQRKVCVRHDRAYYFGGTVEDRQNADAALYYGLVDAGMSSYWAWQYWACARMFGGPLWGWANVNTRAWGWGGQRFAYVRKPHE